MESIVEIFVRVIQVTVVKIVPSVQEKLVTLTEHGPRGVKAVTVKAGG